MNICMTRHTEALAYALNELGKEQYKQYIDAIYLYGSCARGTAKYHSDVDLFLQLKQDTPSSVIRAMKTDVNSGREELPVVELKTSTFGDFGCNRQFAENIKTEGMCLWKRD